MRKPRGVPQHQMCPREFKSVPDLTGSFELDQVIQRNSNADVPKRLDFYLDRGNNAYGPKTGYSGYHGYSGDD